MRLMVILGRSRTGREAIGGHFSGEEVAAEQGEIISYWHGTGGKQVWVVINVQGATAVQDWLSA